MVFIGGRGGKIYAVAETKGWFIHLKLSYTKIVTMLIIPEILENMVLGCGRHQ